MIQEIFKNIYKLEIPIFNSPLEALNSYVIKGLERSLIIDTGLNQEECMNSMQAGLREIGVDLRETDFFITHIHPDHIGLVPRLATDTTRIYFNQPEADWIRMGINWNDFIPLARSNGFPEEELQMALQIQHGFEFIEDWHLPFHILKEGDTIGIGENVFRCIETPGHSRGHMCLYEANKKIFVSGDHILSDITSGIQLWSNDWDPIKEYLESLEKVDQLDIGLMLPGHRDMIRNYRERIQELKLHHERRSKEIVSILEKGNKNAFQIGSQMSWDISCDSWDRFPFLQKCFAVGEAIAHLKS
jgi:glyoxylase-like metal-dependent hydrolase (beta-lactamase superfamily II)